MILYRLFLKYRKIYKEIVYLDVFYNEKEIKY